MIYYQYKESARVQGGAAFVFVLIFAAIALYFIVPEWLTGLREPPGLFKILDMCGASVLAFGFTIVLGCIGAIALSLLVSGGAWSCEIDDRTLRWSVPSRLWGPPHRMDIAAIKSLILEFSIVGNRRSISYYIATADEEVDIQDHCFGGLEPFLEALLRVNPAIELVRRGDGKMVLMGREERIAQICESARLRIKPGEPNRASRTDCAPETDRQSG